MKSIKESPHKLKYEKGTQKSVIALLDLIRAPQFVTIMGALMKLTGK